LQSIFFILNDDHKYKRDPDNTDAVSRSGNSTVPTVSTVTSFGGFPRGALLPQSGGDTDLGGGSPLVLGGVVLFWEGRTQTLV
jgi:hypothetical protein